MKMTLPCLIAAVLFITGCKLDKPDLNDPNNYLNGGGNTGGNTKISAADYLPLTKGTFWEYKNTADGITDTIITTMTGATIVIGGITYYAGISAYKSNAVPPQTGYFAVNNHQVITQTVAEGNTIQLVYLVDNVAVGDTWDLPVNSTNSINGVPAKVIGKLVEVNITKTVEGKTFTSVVHTELTIQYDYGSGFETAETVEMYLAKGVGVIETDTSLLGTTSIETIIDYSVK